MCCNENQRGCQKPENLTGKPGECTAEQIRKCHGNVQGHPCAEPAGCEHSERLRGKPGECSPDQIRQCHGTAPGHPCEQK